MVQITSLSSNTSKLPIQYWRQIAAPPNSIAGPFAAGTTMRPQEQTSMSRDIMCSHPEVQGRPAILRGRRRSLVASGKITRKAGAGRYSGPEAAPGRR